MAGGRRSGRDAVTLCCVVQSRRVEQHLNTVSDYTPQRAKHDANHRRLTLRYTYNNKAFVLQSMPFKVQRLKVEHSAQAWNALRSMTLVVQVPEGVPQPRLAFTAPSAQDAEEARA